MEIYIPDWIAIWLFGFLCGMAVVVYVEKIRKEAEFNEGNVAEFMWTRKLRPDLPKEMADICDDNSYVSLEGFKVLLEGAGLQSYEEKFASIGIKSMEDLHKRDVQELMGKVGLTPLQIWKLTTSDHLSDPKFVKYPGNTLLAVDAGHISWILLYRDAYTARHLDYKKVKDYGTNDIKDKDISLSSPHNVPYWLKNYKEKNQ